MYLKRLHLKGFKSFADTTDILFKPGVNVLVGPNGCGKSNIVDAVRWVLGNSRSKELRAQKQEDVIFNGAEGSRAQNMARVDMILDNQDSVLPLEYNEVGVSRKLFRNGETEFQINQTRVRLKDIGELFNDTGIGRQGYAVIGQGEVEAVLTGKPWERRMMIEEAAGMVRYRQEREEILRRLMHSQNDVVRIQDLLAELRGQLEILQEKAERAEKYTLLKEERRELVTRVLTAEILQRFQKLEARKQQAQELEKQIQRQNEQLQDMQNQEEGISQNIEQARAGEQQAYEQLENFENILRGYKNEAGVLQERLKHFEQNVEQLCHEAAQNQQQIERIAPDVQNSRADYERRVGEVEQDYKIQQEQEQHYQQLSEQLKTEQAALTREQQQNVAEQQKSERLAADLEQQKRTLLSACEEKKYQELRLSEQKQQEELEQQRLYEAETQLEQAQGQQEIYQKQQSVWEENLNENRSQYELQKQQALENEKLADRLKNQIQLLQQMMENYALHPESVRKLLLAAENEEAEIPGLLGSVSDLIETPQNLALAVETALGGALDHLVTRTAEDASAGIDYLKKVHGGRASFLPLDNLRIQTLEEDWKQKILQYRGVVGIASDLISCREEAEPALLYLLGRTVIVETLEDGLKVFRGIHHPVRLVSLEGDLIHPGGTMAGGSQLKNRVGILARKARKKQLQQEWKDALHTWQESVQCFQQTEKDWQNFCQEGENLRHKQQENALRIQSLTENSREQRKKTQEVSRLKQKTEMVYQKLIESIQNQEKNVEQAESAFRIHKEHVQKMQENSGSRQDDFHELQKSCELLKERMKAWQEQLQMKKQEAEARKSYWKQLEDIQHSYEASSRQAQQQLQIKRKEQQKIQEQLAQLQQKISVKEDEVKRQVAVLDELQEILEKVQEREKKNQEILLPVQEQLEKNMNVLHEKQLQQVRLEAELENWLEKWRQELGKIWQPPNINNHDIPEIQNPVSWGEIHQKQLRVQELEHELELLGEVDSGAVQEYKDALERCTFMENQLEDLSQARQKLMNLLKETEHRIDHQFDLFYEQLQQKFNETFQHIFSGGQARLDMEELPEDESALNRGVEIVVQMPGKRVQNLSLLSGGEKALTGIAFVFALLNLKNAPFCVMDEIDAPLDEVNLARFIEFVRQMSQETQFIIISHRQATIASGAVIYGITMARRGISKVLSLNLEQAEEMEQKKQLDVR